MLDNEKSSNSHLSPPYNRLKRFALITVSILVILLIIVSPIILNQVVSSSSAKTHAAPLQTPIPNPLPEPEVIDQIIIPTEVNAPPADPVPTVVDPIDKNPDSITNLLLLGLDADRVNSDTIMVISYDSEGNKISILSVPRDTYVVMPPERVSALQAENFYVPSSGVMKATDVHNYAATHSGEYTKLQFEELLGINIDFYASVDLSAFRKIVDLIGGVQITVPKGGMKTRNPERFLNIDLPEGTYTMNGAQAEQYVRMREMYPDMDLSRIKNQQNFIKQIIKQVLNKDTILNNLPQYIYTVLTHLRTDVTLDDAIKYVKYIKVFDTDNIDFYTLPGEVIKQYYVHDPQKTQDIVEEVFYREHVPNEETAIETELKNE